MLVKKIISKYYKKKIVFKRPNDLLKNKKKICVLFKENLIKIVQKFLILVFRINLLKILLLKNYLTINIIKFYIKKVSIIYESHAQRR